MKILLVEDSPTLRHAMSQFILAAGHEPVMAESGEEALQVIERTAVGLVIMDVEMPGLDGFETTRLIREWLGDHWVPIIFVTGKSEEESLKMGIESGGDDYLIKPVCQVIITAKIRTMERLASMREKLNALDKKLVTISQRDKLTGLFNRHTFQKQAANQWRLAARNKTPLCVLLIDIDYFKEYNDCYGHPAGDKCIQKVADIVAQSTSRPTDVVGRYNGEEFIVLLPNTPEQGAHFIAEQIRKGVERLNIKHRGSHSFSHVTVSVGGIALDYTTGTTWNHQISLADKALLKSKHNGRNETVIERFDPKALILVVDDDDKSLHLIRNQLKDNCSIVTTKSVDECLRLAAELQPNLILIDVYIPGVNGYETCQFLTKNVKTQHIPIILSCQTEHQSEVELFVKQVGASGWLTKPFEKDKVLECLEAAITSKN